MDNNRGIHPPMDLFPLKAKTWMARLSVRLPGFRPINKKEVSYVNR